jgi:dipeptidase D
MESSFEKVMENFRTIVSIPRPSYDEKQISDYLAGFGRALGLNTVQDDALNVIIKKPGSKGYEDAPPVILQGHMDIVYVSDGNAVEARAITAVEENGWIKADGTSLGADNGIALAYIMTILQSDNIPHPPIEALFTTCEETGMQGALSLDPSKLTGKTLINIDSETEGRLVAGCAGGVISTVRIPIRMEPIGPGDTALVIRIHNLRGGHSGVEIDKQRGNAIKLLGRVLRGISRYTGYELVSIDGGAKSNVIPFSASAIISVVSGCMEKIETALRHWQDMLRKEYSLSDPDLTVTFSPCDHSPACRMSRESKDRILRGIMMMPHGVHEMSLEVPGLVQSSCNLGVISATETNVVLTSLIRSSSDSVKAFLAETICCIAESLEGSASLSDDYPGWEYSRHSPVRDVCVKVYEDMYGKTPGVSIIHAGLECGVLGKKLPGVDMISYGPDIIGAHTTGERMSLSSARRVWEYTLAVLRNLE